MKQQKGVGGGYLRGGVLWQEKLPTLLGCITRLGWRMFILSLRAWSLTR